MQRPAYARRSRVFSILGGVAVLAMLSSHRVSYAQQSARPDPPSPNYTGDTSRMNTDDVLVGRRRFAAGARSAWHIHPRGQLILVEEGHGRVQRRGEPPRELGPGQSDFTGPGIAHWHGAAPDQHSVQVTMSFGGIGPWLEPVADKEYLAPGQR